MTAVLPIKVKVCGLTRVEDLVAAKKLGAKYFGQIFYPKSPRCVADDVASALREVAPFGSRVAVDVEPAPERVTEFLEMGYNFVQIHFRPDRISTDRLERWSWAASPDRLWLAPKLADLDNFDPEWIQFGDNFLIDSYTRERFGGSGKTGDWEGFARLVAAYPEKNFILAGGLNATNVSDAIATTGARMIDVNSGVELEPGLKCCERLEALFAAIRELG